MFYKLIGILGGSFDPIHLGHLHIINTLMRQVDFQEIRIIPCYQSPLRRKPYTTPKHRIAMLQLATASNPFLRIDTYEINKKQVSYTIDTLKHFRKEIPSGVAFCLIMGMDAFAQFTSWREWQSISEFCHIIVVNRPGVDKASKILPPNLPATIINHPTKLHRKAAGLVWFVDIKPLDISASTIRHFIKTGQDVNALLPPTVWQYIEKYKLYQSC